MFNLIFKKLLKISAKIVLKGERLILYSKQCLMSAYGQLDHRNVQGNIQF